jgi:ferredoxin
MSQAAYEKFIAWLNKTWIGLPDSESLLPVVKARYSEEEAELLTGMPFSPKELSELSRAKGIPPGELSRKLDDLAGKGIVFRLSRGGNTYYALNDAFFVYLRGSFWPGRTDEASRAIAPLMNRYFLDGFFDQYAHVHTRGLRALPVEESIDTDAGRQVLPYEDVAGVLEKQDYFCVTTCPCRHRKNLDPSSPDCTHSTENCLHFGYLARYIVENGLGREITREETRDILRKAADEGLVHGVSNWLKGVDTICSCCKCCCMWFESFHVLRHERSMDPSNYVIGTSPETCKACGLCVKRCPMEALHLEETPKARNRKSQAAVAEISLCIGCGVCAHKCPTKSLRLLHRHEVNHPPEDPRDYVKRYLTEQKSARSR